MKATKKIVGAACALVAAVALSAGSTFAWFTSNDKATASGMQVQATVPTNLYIAKNYVTAIDSVNETEIDFEDEAPTELKAAAISTTEVTGATISADSSTTPLTDGKVYVVAAATYEEGKKPSATDPGTPATYTAVDTLAAASDGFAPTPSSTAYKDYVYFQDMTLANKSKDLSVDATVKLTYANTDTYKFIRTGFVIGTPSTSGEGESATTTWSYSYVTMENKSGDTGVTSSSTETSFVYTNLIEQFDNNTLKTITFLVWFDGNDADCFVNNAASVAPFNISIEYAAKALPSS